MTDASQLAWQTTHNRWSLVARRIPHPSGVSVSNCLRVARTPDPIVTDCSRSLVMFPGLLLRGLASGHVQKDKQLTTSGPYAYTRNPLYLGSLMLAAGFAIAARSWWIVGILILMFALIYVPVIAGEERFLRQTFPEYADYASLSAPNLSTANGVSRRRTRRLLFHTFLEAS